MEVERPGSRDRGGGLTECTDRLAVFTATDVRFGAGNDRLGAVALLARNTALEKFEFDAEPGRQPCDRLVGGTGLATFYLGDVLLRESVAGELGLREVR